MNRPLSARRPLSPPDCEQARTRRFADKFRGMLLQGFDSRQVLRQTDNPHDDRRQCDLILFMGTEELTGCLPQIPGTMLMGVGFLSQALEGEIQKEAGSQGMRSGMSLEEDFNPNWSVCHGLREVYLETGRQRGRTGPESTSSSCPPVSRSSCLCGSGRRTSPCGG
jgi:hypothetical protein